MENEGKQIGVGWILEDDGGGRRRRCNVLWRAWDLITFHLNAIHWIKNNLRK